MSILTVLYPAKPDARFDFEYYMSRHAPLVKAAWSPVEVVVRKGVSDPGGGQPPFLLTADIVFASRDALNAAMASPRTGEVVADVANFTDIQPVTQIAEPLG